MLAASSCHPARPSPSPSPPPPPPFQITGDAFKVLIHSSVLQKVGAGLHSVTSCFYDSQHDGVVTVRWESPTMLVCITVFGICLE